MRMNATLRRMVRETTLTVDDLIMPLFIKSADGGPFPISSMPEQYQWSLEQLPIIIERIQRAHIPAVILFGVPDHKDAYGTENYDSQGIIPTAIRKIKTLAPDLIVISDMCFCEYTDHGHCGIVNTFNHDDYDPNLPEGYLLNDPTLELLAKAACVHAQAGADIIAPSGMLDGMVAAIRQGLDAEGFSHTAIMSYAVKYASAFYGPFREAADSAPAFGDRRQYQMNPANSREALYEAALDAAEGADVLMVKPSLSYLDVLAMLKMHHHLPLAAYQVSGEYAMFYAAAQRGWIDLRQTALESLISIKRAGADMIITYFALEAALWLKEGYLD